MSHHDGSGAFENCADALRSAPVRDVYEILPRICVCKDKGLLPVVAELLFSGDREREELAACTMAALCDPEGLPHLFGKLDRADTFRGAGSLRLQTAILEAVGEIGDDSASEKLLELFGRRLKGDRFLRKRRVIILDALGSIALQGGQSAVDILVGFLDHEDFLVRANTLTNLSNAFWHRPNELPLPVFEKMLTLFRDSNLYVQYALISALENLADVGCRMAADIFAD